jgi:hypothetical protein
MARFRRGFVAVALAVSVLPLGAAGAGSPCGRAAAARAGRWFVVAPPLPAHSATHQAVHGDLRVVRAAATDPLDPRVVVVTDGERVQRSDDGGCTWRQVWQLPEGPSADAPDRDVAQITAVDVAHVGRRSRVLLAVAGIGWGLPGSARTYLVRSDDGRTGWTLAGDVATLTGTYDASHSPWPPVVHTSGPSGSVAYAAVPSPAGTVAYVRSDDGGRTWSARSAPADPSAPIGLTGFAVSPWDANDLWEWGGGTSRTGDPLTRLRHSTDGARTWRPVDPWPAFGSSPPTWYSVDVAWPRKGAPARLLVPGGTPDSSVTDLPPVLSWSGDGGRTFRQVVPPVRTSLHLAAVAHSARGDAFVVAPNGETFRIACGTRAPRAADWRRLAATPVRIVNAHSALGYEFAGASATGTPVLVVRTTQRVELLTVPR